MFSASQLNQVRIAPAPHTGALLRVAVAGRDARALAAIVAAFDDVVIVDDVDSCDIVVGDKTQPLDVPLLVLLSDGADAFEVIAAGARGAISRHSSPSRIHAALRAIDEGLIVIDREPARDSEPLIDPLTAREQDVLALLAAGLTNKEIASRLGITDHTVKFHVNAILAKLGAETRTEAVVHAAKLGIVVL
jgi:DNA-binding NarL/FixJ family response regulator